MSQEKAASLAEMAKGNILVLRPCPYQPEDLVWATFSILMAMVNNELESHGPECECPLRKVAEAALTYLDSRRIPGVVDGDPSNPQ